jgi:acyl-CoA synthetase (AMP-forming)/AMP-acid ligase II
LWGATEAACSLTYGLEPGPISRIVPGAQVQLVDERGEPVPHGAIGELLVRGPNVTVGYWQGPGRIDDAIADGWFHTGDLMRRGEGDELWFVARKKDLIIRGGSNIAPAEVEHVLLTHPMVTDAAVVGVPDPVLGQRVVGVVQLETGIPSTALDGILATVRAQLADYKVPEWLMAVDAIPRNALGKVARTSLAVMAKAHTNITHQRRAIRRDLPEAADSRG